MKRGIGFYTKIVLIILLFLAIISYGAYQSRKLVSGPTITISSPKNGETVSDQSIMISGTVSNASNITLNDNPIVIDEAGNFSEERALSQGLNIFKLAATNQFKKTTIQTLQIVYQP